MTRFLSGRFGTGLRVFEDRYWYKIEAILARTEVANELRNRNLPTLRALTLLDEEWQPWRRYRPSARLCRDPRQGQVTRGSAFLRIELAEPVPGPVALGHLSHFGLGLLIPECESVFADEDRRQAR